MKGQWLTCLVLQGIVIGLDNLDSVIQTIRETSNHTMAKESLAKGNVFNFSFIGLLI
jgi:DNA gyrase/topoisomerase IV subunit A